MKKVIFIIILLIFIFLISAWWGYKTDNPYFLKLANTRAFRGIVERLNKELYKRGTVKIKENIINVEVAMKPLAKFKGLSWRKSLGENKGMLFVYGTPNYYTFWMKDMMFPLDIIWIDNNQIIDITKNIPPARRDYAPTYAPALPVNYVLEVNAGYADKHGIKIGDKVEIEIMK